MTPQTATETAQIIQNALPPQWHGITSLVMQGAVLLVLAGHFCARNGGVKGIFNAVLNGKPNS